MKFLNIAIVSLLLSCNSFAANDSQFSYIELSKFIVSVEEIDDANGFGVEGKYEIQEYLYLNGAYQNYDNKFIDVERLTLGVGAKYDVNDFFIPFSQLDYIGSEGEGEGKGFSFKFDGTQYRLGLGIAGAYKQFFYKVGVNGNFASGGDNYSTVKFAEASFVFGKSFSVIAKVELGNQDVFGENQDEYSVGARYHF